MRRADLDCASDCRQEAGQPEGGPPAEEVRKGTGEDGREEGPQRQERADELLEGALVIFANLSILSR